MTPKRYEEVLADFEAENERLGMLWDRLEAVEAERAELEQSLNALEDDKRKAAAQYAESGDEAELSAVEARIAEHTGRLAQLGTRIDAMEDAIAEQTRAVESAQGSVGSVCAEFWRVHEAKLLEKARPLLDVLQRAYHARRSQGSVSFVGRFPDYFKNRVLRDVWEVRIDETAKPEGEPDVPSQGPRSQYVRQLELRRRERRAA